MAGLSQINIPSLKKLYSGKVRDTFAVGDDKLLIVASDRISAFVFQAEHLKKIYVTR